MLLQGNFVKVFVKIKVLKLPEVKCSVPMVSLYLENTYRLRGGGRGGDSTSGAMLRGAVFGRAPPHLLVSTTAFASVFPASL